MASYRSDLFLPKQTHSWCISDSSCNPSIYSELLVYLCCIQALRCDLTCKHNRARQGPVCMKAGFTNKTVNTKTETLTRVLLVRFIKMYVGHVSHLEGRHVTSADAVTVTVETSKHKRDFNYHICWLTLQISWIPNISTPCSGQI